MNAEGSDALSSEQMAAISDSINDGVFTVDEAWPITSFNRAAEAIAGSLPKRPLAADVAMCFEPVSVSPTARCGKRRRRASPLSTRPSTFKDVLTSSGDEDSLLTESTRARVRLARQQSPRDKSRSPPRLT